MIVEPERYVDAFAQGGRRLDHGPRRGVARTCTARSSRSASLGAQGRRGAQPAHAARTTIRYVLGDVDLVLVMSVNPGFGGQSFIPARLAEDRARSARRSIERGLRRDLEVDGGVAARTAARGRSSGRARCWWRAARCSVPPSPGSVSEPGRSGGCLSRCDRSSARRGCARSRVRAMSLRRFIRGAFAACALALVACSAQPVTPLPGIDVKHEVAVGRVASASLPLPGDEGDRLRSSPWCSSGCRNPTSADREAGEESLARPRGAPGQAAREDGRRAATGDHRSAGRVASRDRAGARRLRLRGRPSQVAPGPHRRLSTPTTGPCTFSMISVTSSKKRRSTTSWSTPFKINPSASRRSSSSNQGGAIANSAVQSLIEGDATSAMFEVDGGSSLQIDEKHVAPDVLVLDAPLVGGSRDPSIPPGVPGVALYRRLRLRAEPPPQGGWGEVDRAFKNCPDHRADPSPRQVHRA